jgi:tripartite-type tricarboxylate transporter receptor subunit TctC
MIRRLFLLLGLASVLQAAAAAGFPDKPVQIIVPYTPGGLTDNIARLYAERLGKLWHQAVVVENKPGAGAAIGAAAVARAPADGYTLLIGSVGMATNPYMLKRLPYDPKSLLPLSRIALAPNVLYIHPSVPATNVSELIAFAKKNPGKLSFASSGIGSSPHLAAELFAAKAGINVLQVPYKGTGAAIADFLGGQVNAYFDTMQSMTYADAGKIRALAIATDKRIPEAPNLPTVDESGAVQGVFSSSWFGFYLPASTPADVRDKIVADLRTIGAERETQERIAKMGLIPSYQGPEAFASFNRDEEKRWSGIIAAQHISIE